MKSTPLRYGENPHQTGIYYGNLREVFQQLNGKNLSYNNLLDIDSAVNLMAEFQTTSFGILKHNNACGFSSDNNPANIAVESGTAARTIPPLPAGMVCIATAVKIGNANTTPMAVIISFRKSVLSGKFSDLNWPLNNSIKTDAIPAKNPLPNPISRDVKSAWVKCLVIGRVREKITTPIKPRKNP